METTPTPMSGIAPTKVSSHRTFLFSLIIIAVVVIAGVVIMAAGRDFEGASDETYSSTPENDAVTQQLNTQGSSNDLNEIDADLKATNFDNVQ
jgi:hypothetical protein